MFDSVVGAFGVAGASNGTTIKFVPVTGSDTFVKNSVTQSINIKHLCITCMREYEGKSLEELRFEDYVANRKGPSQVSNIPRAKYNDLSIKYSISMHVHVGHTNRNWAVWKYRPTIFIQF